MTFARRQRSGSGPHWPLDEDCTEWAAILQGRLDTKAPTRLGVGASASNATKPRPRGARSNRLFGLAPTGLPELRWCRQVLRIGWLMPPRYPTKADYSRNPSFHEERLPSASASTISYPKHCVSLMIMRSVVDLRFRSACYDRFRNRRHRLSEGSLSPIHLRNRRSHRKTIRCHNLFVMGP